MSADKLYPIVVIQDRHHGTYSGGLWFAVAMADAPFFHFEIEPTRCGFCLEDGPNHEDDGVARAFWAHVPEWVAAGNTPEAALQALLEKHEHP